MGRGCGLPDFRARAEAGVEESRPEKSGESLVVGGSAFGLAHRHSVPVDSQSGQIAELAVLELGPGALGVEVLDPDQEPRPLRAREQPRDQRGSQAAQM